MEYFKNSYQIRNKDIHDLENKLQVWHGKYHTGSHVCHGKYHTGSHEKRARKNSKCILRLKKQNRHKLTYNNHELTNEHDASNTIHEFYSNLYQSDNITPEDIYNYSDNTN